MLNESHDLHHDLEVFYVHIHGHHHVSSDQSRADIDVHQRFHNDATSGDDQVSGHIHDQNHDLQSSRVGLLFHSDALLRVRGVQPRIYDRGGAYTHIHLCGRMDHLKILYHEHDDDHVNNLQHVHAP